MSESMYDTPWISAKAELPAEGQRVIVHSAGRFFTATCLRPGFDRLPLWRIEGLEGEPVNLAPVSVSSGDSWAPVPNNVTVSTEEVVS